MNKLLIVLLVAASTGGCLPQNDPKLSKSESSYEASYPVQGFLVANIRGHEYVVGRVIKNTTGGSVSYSTYTSITHLEGCTNCVTRR